MSWWCVDDMGESQGLVLRNLEQCSCDAVKPRW